MKPMKAETKKTLTDNAAIALLVFAGLYLWKYLQPRLVKLSENIQARWCAWRAPKAEAQS